MQRIQAWTEGREDQGYRYRPALRWAAIALQWLEWVESCPLGGLAFSDGTLQLGAEFCAVLMAVHLCRVLSRGIDEFAFAVR
jgi:hypothetical protein